MKVICENCFTVNVVKLLTNKNKKITKHRGQYTAAQYIIKTLVFMNSLETVYLLTNM